MNLEDLYKKLVSARVLTESTAALYQKRKLVPMIESGGMAELDPASRKIVDGLVKVETLGRRRIRLVIPATRLDVENLNKRVYPSQVLAESIKACKEKMRRGYITGGVYDHPETPFVAPGHSSHKIVDAYVQNHGGTRYLMNVWEVLGTDAGRNLRALIEGGVAFGVSIRGFGRTDNQFNENEGTLQEYEFLGTDCVGEPSSQVYADFSGPLAKIVESTGREITTESLDDEKERVPAYDGTTDFAVYSHPDGWAEQVTHKGLRVKKESRIALDESGGVMGVILPRPFRDRDHSIAVLSSQPFASADALVKAYRESVDAVRPAMDETVLESNFAEMQFTIRNDPFFQGAPVKKEGNGLTIWTRGADRLYGEGVKTLRLYPSKVVNMIAYTLLEGGVIRKGPVLLGSDTRYALQKIKAEYSRTFPDA